MGRVLVVDDTDDVRLMLRLTLELHGWEVEEAADGEVALDLCHEQEFDAVILDHKMPRLSGAEVAYTLRDEGYSTPIILFSGYLTREIEDRLRACNVQTVPKEGVAGLVSVLSKIGEP